MTGIYKAIIDNNISLLAQLLGEGEYDALNQHNYIYDGKSYSAFSLAVAMGRLECVKLLIENDANIRANNDEAFILANENGQEEILNYLLHQIPEEDEQPMLHKARDDDFRGKGNVGRKEILEY